jgi:AcrR family transcriptional regulator
MNEKKQQILQSAMKLFAENGFHSTSMQGIADQIGIAKGTLYIHFKSKEQLLLSILKQYQHDLFEKIEFVEKDSKLNSKEILVKQVYVKLVEFQKNSDFIKMQFKEQLNHENEAVKAFAEQRKAKILNWIKKGILGLYGEKITPNLWDLVILFNGMIREYMLLLVFERKPIDIAKASEFIVNRLDDMARVMIETKSEAIITADMMSDIAKADTQALMDTQEEILTNELNKITAVIKALHVKDEKKEELLDAVHALKEEISQKSPRKFMIKALTALLESIDDCRIEVIHLKGLLYLKFDFHD